MSGTRDIRRYRKPIGAAKDKTCAYCHLHKARLSPKQMKSKECLKKQCRHLVPWKQHPYWAQREREKELKKQRKQERKEAMTNAIHPVQAPDARV